MLYLKNLYLKRLLRQHDCKLAGGLRSLNKRTELVLETGAKLGHVRIGAKRLHVGAYTYIRSGTHLSLVSSIGRFCSIGNNVIIGQEKYTHPTDWLSTHPFQYEPPLTPYEAPTCNTVIGHDVWIGHSAMILEGVKVGVGAVIATRAVVATNVPPYAIVAGNPAKVVRFRHSSEMVERLLASEWWEWETRELQKLRLNEPELCLRHLERNDQSTKYPKLRVWGGGQWRVE